MINPYLWNDMAQVNNITTKLNVWDRGWFLLNGQIWQGIVVGMKLVIKHDYLSITYTMRYSSGDFTEVKQEDVEEKIDDLLATLKRNAQTCLI